MLKLNHIVSKGKIPMFREMMAVNQAEIGFMLHAGVLGKFAGIFSKWSLPWQITLLI
jgi:hypothetical protein